MNDELVTIATYPTPAEAEVARVAIEAEGITAFVTNDNLVGMTWILGTAVGNVKLLVAASHAERATQLLKTRFDDWTQGDAEPWNCPRCGEEIERIRRMLVVQCGTAGRRDCSAATND